jgi:hypothetical protein
MKYVRPIAVSLLLMLALTAGIAMGADPSAAVTLTGSIPVSASITVDNANVAFGSMSTEVAATGSATLSYTSNAQASKIDSTVGNAGYMKDGTKQLTNKLEVKGEEARGFVQGGIIYSPLSKATTAATAPVAFRQNVAAGDAPGSYSTTVTFTLTVVTP